MVVTFRCTCSCRNPKTGDMPSNSIYAISNRNSGIASIYIYIYFIREEGKESRPRACRPMTRCVFRFPEFVSCVFSAFLPGAISVISSIDFIATLLANIKNLSRLPSRWRDGRAQLNSSRFSQGFFFCFPLHSSAPFRLLFISFHSFRRREVCLPWSAAPRRASATSLHNPLANTLVTSTYPFCTGSSSRRHSTNTINKRLEKCLRRLSRDAFQAVFAPLSPFSFLIFTHFSLSRFSLAKRVASRLTDKCRARQKGK